MTLRTAAKKLKKAGRKGDKQLLHISDEELLALQATGRVTVNPKTGLPEAWSFPGSNIFQGVSNAVSNAVEGIGHTITDAGTAVSDWASNTGGDFSRGANTTVSPSGSVKGPLAPGSAVAGLSSVLGVDDARRQYAHDTGPLGQIYEGLIFSGGFSGYGSGGETVAGGEGSENLLGNAGGTSMPPAVPEFGDPTNPPMMPPAQVPVGDPTLPPAGPGPSAPGEPSFFANPGGDPSGPFGPSVNNGGGDSFGQGTPFGQGTDTTGFGTGSMAENAANDPTWYTKMLQNIAANPWKSAGLGLNLGSGIYGMYAGNQARQAAKQPQVYDPFSTQRAGYQKQLAELTADPSLITKDPSYAAGMQAVERRMAANGYLGSGNMMTEMANYGGNFYNNAVTRLGQLAGANLSPVRTDSSAMVNANAQMSRSLATLGFSLAQLAA